MSKIFVASKPSTNEKFTLEIRTEPTTRHPNPPVLFFEAKHGQNIVDGEFNLSEAKALHVMLTKAIAILKGEIQP